MFHDIPQRVLDRMQHLEERDASDRADGTPRSRRLRQIPPETGRFLALLVAMAPPGEIVEIGTSAGYSTLWLTIGAGGRRIRTFETDPDKVALAAETFEAAGVDVELVTGDAREHLPEVEEIGFCFLDADKEVYRDCYDLVVPRLVEGGILVADNAISHAAELQPMIDAVLADPRINAIVVPIGTGELVCLRTAKRPGL